MFGRIRTVTVAVLSRPASSWIVYWNVTTSGPEGALVYRITRSTRWADPLVGVDTLVILSEPGFSSWSFSRTLISVVSPRGTSAGSGTATGGLLTTAGCCTCTATAAWAV